MDSTSDDERWKRWREQVEIIDKEVRGLMESDARFRLSMKALEKWPASRLNVTYDWLVAMYARDAAVQIRRMLDRTGGVMSLWRLITDIQRHPLVCSRERFVLAYLDGLGGNATRGAAPTPEENARAWQRTAAQIFDDLAGGNHGHWPASVAQRDIDALEEQWKRSGLERITQTRIAHHVPEQPLHGRAIWQDTHDCIATLERIAKRYFFLLLQADRPAFGANHEAMIDEGVRRFWLGERNDSEPASANR